MIGGSEPPPEPKKPKVKVASSWSGTVSGHGGASAGRTPHDRVMAIINKEEQKEAEARRKDVLDSASEKDKSGFSVQSPV